MDSTGARWHVGACARADLVATARRMGLSLEEAQDVASEAILRAGCNAGLDVQNAQAWLRVVTRRLAVDVHRRRPSTAFLSRLTHADVPGQRPQDEIDDNAEARWLASALDELPPSQQVVMRMRVDGHSPRQIATHLGCTYKTVESLTSRARARLRTVLATTLAALGFGAAASRRAGPAAAVMSVAVAAVLLLAPLTTPWSNQPPQLETSQAGASAANVASTARRTADPAELPLRQLRTEAAPRSARPVMHELIGPVKKGPVRYSGARQERTEPDRDLVQSVQDCVSRGPEISQEHIGCRAS